MAYHFNQTAFTRTLADHMVEERFGAVYGTHDLTSYFDFVDIRQATLFPGETVRQASAQRRKIKLAQDNNGTLIAKVPMKDPRRIGATIWAETELGTLFDLIENGADGAWCVNYARTGSKKAYVKTRPPLAGAKSTTGVTVGRLIAGAGKGRSVRFVDGSPQNLRRNNLFVFGKDATGGGAPTGSKHDALAIVQEGSRTRALLAKTNDDKPENRGA